MLKKKKNKKEAFALMIGVDLKPPYPYEIETKLHLSGYGSPLFQNFDAEEQIHVSIL